jgi:DNA-binding CsgD family transcriptional regulator
MDESFNEMIQKRSLPGILIFNQKQKLAYINSEARMLLDAINNLRDRLKKGPPVMPDEIYRLCKSVISNPPTKQAERPSLSMLIFQGDKQYLIRASILFSERGKKNKEPSHIMVAIEPCTPNRNIDINGLRTRFDLTKREAQIVGEIVKGFTNKEIAESLFISKYTVKGHIQIIMNKLGVHNRTSVFYKVFE